MAQATIASIPQSNSVQEVARAIVLLVNYRPQSPTVDEIAAVIEYVGQHHPRELIEDVAQQAADLSRLHMRLQEAQSEAERAQDKQAKEDIQAEAHVTLCHTVNRLRSVAEAAYSRSRYLQNLIVLLDPRTTSEVLSLALATRSALEDYEDHTDEDHKRLDAAMTAIIRGLVRTGATSPLLDIWASKADLVPWDKERAAAEADAEKFGGAHDQPGFQERVACHR